MKENRPQSPKPPEPRPAGKPAARPGFFRPRNLLFILSALVLLAAAAMLIVLNFNSYRCRGPNAAINADVKNAYTSSQAFFSDCPEGCLDAVRLARYGFTQTSNVIVVIQDGTRSGLSITAEHRQTATAKRSQTETTYTVDSTGKITKGIPPWRHQG